MVNRIRRYLEEAWSELRKVHWPTRQQTVSLTALVFVGSAIVGVFIFSMDVLFTRILTFVAGQ